MSSIQRAVVIQRRTPEAETNFEGLGAEKF